MSDVWQSESVWIELAIEVVLPPGHWIVTVNRSWCFALRWYLPLVCGSTPQRNVESVRILTLYDSLLCHFLSLQTPPWSFGADQLLIASPNLRCLFQARRITEAILWDTEDVCAIFCILFDGFIWFFEDPHVIRWNWPFIWPSDHPFLEADRSYQFISQIRGYRLPNSLWISMWL